MATPNPETQVQSAELMLSLDGVDLAARTVLEASGDNRLTPEAEGQLLELVAPDVPSDLRPEWLGRVEGALSSDDPERIFELLDRLGGLSLSRQELLQAAHGLCRITEDSSFAHNAVGIQRRFSQASDRLQVHATWQDLCSG
jgi:hypothetical protein